MEAHADCDLPLDEQFRCLMEVGTPEDPPDPDREALTEDGGGDGGNP